MSIYEARMPSLKDKIIEQAAKVEKVEVKEEKVEKSEIKKGRRLNK